MGPGRTITFAELLLSREEGWDDLAPRILRPALPNLRTVVERALGLLREDSTRVLAGEANEAAAPPMFDDDRQRRRAKLLEDVRTRAMAPEDAWERLAPKTWLGDERRWLVAERIARNAQHDGPTLGVAWTSWALRREPSDLAHVLTLCADPENVERAEQHALEACRRMSMWGLGAPPRIVWMAEENARFHDYEGARPFRRLANETLGLEFVPRPGDGVAARHEVAPREADLRAKRDLMRANAWRANAPLGPNPFEPIVEIWRLGYAFAAVHDVGVVLVASMPKLEERLARLV